MKKISYRKAFALSTLFCVPLSVFAEATAASVKGGFGTLAGVVDSFNDTIVKSTATLFLSLALLAFFYGIVMFIWAKAQGETAGIKKGSEFITSALVAIFVMFSVYGIIQLAQGFTGMSGLTDTISLPRFNFGGSGTNPANNGGTTGLCVNKNAGDKCGDPANGWVCDAVGACGMPGNGSATGGTVNKGGTCANTGICRTGLVCDSNKCADPSELGSAEGESCRPTAVYACQGDLICNTTTLKCEKTDAIVICEGNIKSKCDLTNCVWSDKDGCRY